jgi:hypothetical protein
MKHTEASAIFNFTCADAHLFVIRLKVSISCMLKQKQIVTGLSRAHPITLENKGVLAKDEAFKLKTGFLLRSCIDDIGSSCLGDCHTPAVFMDLFLFKLVDLDHIFCQLAYNKLFHCALAALTNAFQILYLITVDCLALKYQSGKRV